MDLKNWKKAQPPEKPKPSAKPAKAIVKPGTEEEPTEEPTEEPNEAKPAKRVKRQATQEQLNNPLHGVKLAQILDELVAHYGWEYMAMVINIRCFKYNPTMKSSLGFLRKTPWAREQVQELYLQMLEE